MPKFTPAAPPVIFTTMAKRDPRMIPLGYGKFVRADRIYALVPIEGAERHAPSPADRDLFWACRGGGAAGRPDRKAFCRRFG